MDFLAYRDHALCAEGVQLSRIAAAFGSPVYVYSRAALTAAYQSFAQAFAGRDHLICYAMKANSNLAVLNLFARLGSGFDIVSGGELARVIAAGGDPAKVIFSGVGKTEEEIRAALDADILCFNVESAPELQRISAVADRLGKVARISLRVNPDVDAQTHPYISTGLKENKFGVPIEDAPQLYALAAKLPGLQITGVDCHIGSQLTDIAPFVDALTKVLALLDQLATMGINITHLDLGGGVGIRYRDEAPPEIADYAQALLAKLAGRTQKIILEPGRALVGNAGLLLTKVEYLKHGDHKNFAIVDAAMNDLIRPSLYESYHEILPVVQRADATQLYDVVGPICESGDFLGRDRHLTLAEGDLLAICSAGAYGMVMSSNYNARPRAAEVMVDGDRMWLVRERETIASLFAGERVLDE